MYAPRVYWTGKLLRITHSEPLARSQDSAPVKFKSIVKDDLTTWNETHKVKVIDSTLAVVGKPERKAEGHMNELSGAIAPPGKPKEIKKQESKKNDRTIVHVGGETYANMCTWSFSASANIRETNSRGDERCSKLLDGHIHDNVSKVLYLGGSHIFRIFKAHSQKYNCACRLTVKAPRCNLMKTLGLQRGRRKEHSSCVDNGDSPSTICVDTKSGAECIEQSFISLQFAKDAEMQTESTKTSQETVSLYLKTQARSDICIIGPGFNDLAIPHILDATYSKNVLWYLNVLKPHCSKILVLGLISVTEDPKYPQKNARMQTWNKITAQIISRMEFAMYIDVFTASTASKHVDRKHMHEIFYGALKSMIFDYLIAHNYGRYNPKTGQTVIVVGKGTSAKPVKKTDDTIIVTVNQNLAFQNYSDIHYQLDWYFETVPREFFCRAKALVVPTYFHTVGDTHIHSSLLLSKLKFKGPIFIVQLPDGPIIPNVEMWSGGEALHSSGDLAFAWMVNRGYKRFLSYGFGGTGYANYFQYKYKVPHRFVQNTFKHQDQIRKRFVKRGADWIQNLEPQTTMKKQTKVKQGPCLWPSGWGSKGGYFPTINEARSAGGGDPGVDTRVLNGRTKRTVKPKIPMLKSVMILGDMKNDKVSSDSARDDKGSSKEVLIISVNDRLNSLSHSDIHFQFDWNVKMTKSFLKTDILVVPTFLKRGENYVSTETFLNEFKFTGPVFKIQMDAGPQVKNIEQIHGTNANDMARQWMFNRGYRSFL